MYKFMNRQTNMVYVCMCVPRNVFGNFVHTYKHIHAHNYTYTHTQSQVCWPICMCMFVSCTQGGRIRRRKNSSYFSPG